MEKLKPDIIVVITKTGFDQIWLSKQLAKVITQWLLLNLTTLDSEIVMSGTIPLVTLPTCPQICVCAG